MQLSLASLVFLASALAAAQTTNSSTSLSAYEQIRNTLAMEAFILDTRTLDSLADVYADDATLTFVTDSGNHAVTGVDNIIADEKESLNNSYTLSHQYTMTHVAFLDDGSANATSYATWNKFGGDDTSYFAQTWAKYFDTLIQVDNTWKFQNREVHTWWGPITANVTVS